LFKSEVAVGRDRAAASVRQGAVATGFYDMSQGDAHYSLVEVVAHRTVVGDKPEYYRRIGGNLRGATGHTVTLAECSSRFGPLSLAPP
jgi:hypothetical protein